MITKTTINVFATLALCFIPAVAQDQIAIAAIEETAPAIPVDENALAAADAAQPEEQPASEKTLPAGVKNAPVVTDYTEQIGTGLKERERRLTLLNEAMMKLREAGELEDASRVEERIRALLSMPAPSQANAQAKADLEQMRARNDELIVQMVAMEEELKRYRGPGGSASVVSRKR